MSKIILITGATDGIGFETAKMLAGEGHHLILHGRNPDKLERVMSEVGYNAESFVADFSDLDDVAAMAKAVLDSHAHIDVLINNAGVYKAGNTVTKDGLDIRFVVNTLAPYLLTKALLPIMGANGRVINLSSAAQASVDTAAIKGDVRLDHGPAYAQSKLAITMWSREMALDEKVEPLIVSVNPGSLLGSKMVKENFGIDGGDIGIGADILVRAALSDEFESHSGEYFDNDAGKFAPPHPDGLDREKSGEVVKTLDAMIAGFGRFD